MNDWPTDPVDEIMQLVRQQDAIGYEERMVLVAEIERLRAVNATLRERQRNLVNRNRRGRAHRKAQARSIERLRAMIEPLPKFADGTVAYPGDEGWYPGEAKPGIVSAGNPLVCGNDEWGTDTAECYPTYEAAEKPKESDREGDA